MEDWRLNGQERYLFGKTLLKVSFFENGDIYSQKSRKI